MNGLIAAAVERRRLMKPACSAGNRIGEPHVEGADGGGTELLRCYQIGGESASRERQGRKLLRGAENSVVEVIDVRFAPRAGHDRDDPAIRHTDARVWRENPIGNRDLRSKGAIPDRVFSPAQRQCRRGWDGRGRDALTRHKVRRPAEAKPWFP